MVLGCSRDGRSRDGRRSGTLAFILHLRHATKKHTSTELHLDRSYYTFSPLNSIPFSTKFLEPRTCKVSETAACMPQPRAALGTFCDVRQKDLGDLKGEYGKRVKFSS